MNSILVVSVVLAWVLILAGLWLGWQLLRQNGRLLLRIESLEERLNEMEFAEVPPEGLPVGSPAPEFDLPDLSGARHSLAQWRTQPLLLIFFNPDCGFCRELMPRLTSVAAGFQPAVEGGILPPGKDAQLPGSQTNSVNAPSSQAASAGLEARLNGRQGCLPPQLLLITTGDAEKNRQFFSEHQVISPVLLQKDSEVATAYQAAGTPTGYLISADGKIASELAIGAEALLELANGSPQPSTLNHQPTDDRASRFSSRSLARSRIARNGLKAGTPAPPFRLPRLDGRGELALEDLRGHQVLLVFSDPHCGPCQALAPQLEQLHREHPELRVVMISRGEPRDNRAKVKQFKLTFPIVLQQHWEVSRRYAMFATPIGYLIDERGIVLRDVALGAEGVMQLVPPVAGGRNLSSPQLA